MLLCNLSPKIIYHVWVGGDPECERVEPIRHEHREVRAEGGAAGRGDFSLKLSRWREDGRQRDIWRLQQIEDLMGDGIWSRDDTNKILPFAGITPYSPQYTWWFGRPSQTRSPAGSWRWTLPLETCHPPDWWLCKHANKLHVILS